MAANLKLEIVTPEGQVYSRDVDMVLLPARDGELGIFPQHAPLMTLLGTGEIIARSGGQEDRIIVTSGCAEVTGNQVSVLTVFATEEGAVDVEKAEEARRKAEERLKQKLSPEETSLVQASLAHSLAQLKIKRRPRP
ncbi:MAG: ATP synthase F1 subunit epsilon [Verrucomicrobiales bacterium]|nr:ATP synthase F1 subunit epsilon [Verrucomicrobiales bacterium]MCP5525920.1 ATP synthase F1 subunit epsilon [Verrucomicrobiales bacterium]